MEPTTLLPAIALLSLVTVEFGGWALLGFITTRNGTLGDFRERFFRAGHAHAGVLLLLALTYFSYLDNTGLGTGAQWLLGSMLLAGVLAQSGGFFVHMGLGHVGRGSIGSALTRGGGLLLAVPLISLAIELLRA